MISNPQDIIQNIRTEFEMLLEYVTGETARVATAYQIESGLLKRLLSMGRQLLALFFAMRAQHAMREPMVLEDGQNLPYHSEKKRSYYSIYGKLTIERPYFYKQGHGGRTPLDAELSLGADSYSDLLRDMSEYLGVQMAYNKSDDILNRFLGISVSTRVFKKMMAEDAEDVEAYYEQKPAPTARSEAEILVIQADGKGVPLILETPTKSPVRLGKGQKRGKKKEAIVTSSYTIAPAVRTPEAVVTSFFDQEQELAPGVQKTTDRRPKPQNKHVWATLDGKDTALERLQKQVKPRQGSHILHKVALSDGCEALQERIKKHFPDFTLVLDFVHANEYLWKVANSLLGESDPGRSAWVAEKTLEMLSGRLSQVIADFRQTARQQKTKKAQVEILTKTANYFERNSPYMDYSTYLANGWPIASGVIEGACRHLVRDRMELSGMRWSQTGAENLLRLRAVAENQDWQNYHSFRRCKRHKRLYGTAFPEQTLPEQAFPEPADCDLPAAQSVTTLAPINQVASDIRASYHDLPLAD